MSFSSDLLALLDDLALRSPEEASFDIGEAFADLHWQEASAAEINSVAAAYLPFLHKTATRLRASLRQTGLPLNETSRGQWRAQLRLYRYAQLLLNLVATALHEQDDDRSEYLVRVHQERVEWCIRTMLDGYRVYVDVPSSLMVDLHQLVDLARGDLAQDYPSGWLSIHRHYVAFLTLAVVNPYGLTAEELEDGYECLIQLGEFIHLSQEQPTPTSRFIDLSGKILPHIALTPRASMAAAGAFLDLGRLYEPTALDGLPTPCRLVVYGLLERLQFYFSGRTPRNSNVSASKPVQSSLISLGFISAHHRLERLEYPDRQADLTLSLAGLDWEGLEQPIRGGVQPLVIEPEFKMDIRTTAVKDDLSWEGVHGAPEASTAVIRPGAEWDVINFSSQGFRFHWRLAGNSHAAVDDLLLAEFPQGTSDRPKFALGIVRWVRHMDAEMKTIDMGVQRVPGQMFAGYARDVRSVGAGWSKSWPIIVLLDERLQPVRAVISTALAVEAHTLLVVREGQELRLQLGAVCQTGQDFLIMEVERVDA
ncbi:hypothetical protein [Halothiobacillus sp. DCM-1]|uniref:hypothetical protein n=1 Tax=Halothiobacillus sp. DCM-1 TaxID=3112558 RepID=UPI0032564AA4